MPLCWATLELFFFVFLFAWESVRGKGSLSSWRFSEASGRLDFPGFTSTSRKGGGVQFHLWVGLLERPNCEPWQEWRCIPNCATRNAEISQVVSSKCLMVSCKAECRIFWNSLWNCPVSYYFGCNYCLDLLGFQVFLHSLLCQHAVRKHTLEFRSPEENFDLLGALQGMPAR